MIEQFNEQMQATMKPVTDLATLNLRAVQDLAKQQNSLFTTLLNDGVEFVKSSTGHKDVMSLLDAQKAYFEDVQSKVSSAAQEAYSVVTETQQSSGKIVKAMGEEFSEKFTSMAK